MGFELTPAFWSGLLQIIIVNIVLSGDNALVIALACRNLEKRHQKPAILIGSAGAIVLRIIFVLIVDQLLKIGYLKLIGGLLLLWIGVKLVQGEEEGDDGVKAAGSLWAADPHHHHRRRGDEPRQRHRHRRRRQGRRRP